jgi:hypothetical protein
MTSQLEVIVNYIFYLKMRLKLKFTGSADVSADSTPYLQFRPVRSASQPDRI